MKKANINILVIEELTDLLYELNEVYNLQRDVNCEYGEHLHHRIMKTIFYVAFTIELISKSTDTPREMDETVRAIIRYKEPDGYVDRGDLKHAMAKAFTHIYRMNLAYRAELGQPGATLLEIVQLCLTDTNYLIYGTTTTAGNNLRLSEESPSLQE